MQQTDEPCGTLILKQLDISTTQTAAGFTNSRKRQCTWTGINLRRLLGQSYDEYNLFNIVLTAITGPIGSNLPGATEEDRICMVYMSGLSWVNQSYDTSLKNRTNEALVGNFKFTVGSGMQPQGYISSNPSTFAKSDNSENIVITLKRNSDGAQPTIGDRDFIFGFIFNIYGIKDDNMSHDNGYGIQSNSFLNI